MGTNETIKEVYGLIERRSVVLCCVVSFVALVVSILAIMHNPTILPELIVNAKNDRVNTENDKKAANNMDGIIDICSELATQIEKVQTAGRKTNQIVGALAQEVQRVSEENEALRKELQSIKTSIKGQ